MFNPSQSPVPPNNQSHYHTMPPPIPYQQIRSLPHNFHPPPPPPPDRVHRPEEDFQSELQSSETRQQEILYDEDIDDSQSYQLEPRSSIEPSEPLVGTPLVPRGKEPERPTYGKGSTWNSRSKEDNTPSGSAYKGSVYKGTVYKRPLPVELDPNLPAELVAKLHNHHCELCEVKLNSRIQSKTHYEGKPHKKKVNSFIIESTRKDGQSAAKKTKIDVSTSEKKPKIDVSTSEKKPKTLDASGQSAAKLPKNDDSPSKKKPKTRDSNRRYCKYCDVSLTSEQHAEQHYTGKKHLKVLEKRRQQK